MFWFGSSKRFPPSFRQRIGNHQIEISIDEAQTYIQIVVTDERANTYQRKIMKTDLEDKKDALTDLYQWLHSNAKELVVGDSGDLLIPAKNKGGKMTKIKTYKKHNQSSKMEERLNQLENSNYLLAQELKMKDRKLLDLEQKIIGFSKLVKTMEDKMVEMSEEMKRVKERGRLYMPKPVTGKLGHHQDNLHQHLFVTKQAGPNSLLVKKIANKGYYDNFINYMPVQDREKVIYKLRILKLVQRALWLGFGTKEAFGDITNQSEVCFYSCWDGELWEGRTIRQTGIKTWTGEELYLIVDRIKNKIFYVKRGAKIAETEIPANMYGRQLFLFLQLRDKDDEVEISQEASLLGF